MCSKPERNYRDIEIYMLKLCCIVNPWTTCARCNSKMCRECAVVDPNFSIYEIWICCGNCRNIYEDKTIRDTENYN